MTEQKESKFDPHWKRAFPRVTSRGGFNGANMRAEFDAVVDQTEGLTEEANRTDQRVHELETQVAELVKQLKVLANTSPNESRSAGKRTSKKTPAKSGAAE